MRVFLVRFNHELATHIVLVAADDMAQAAEIVDEFGDPHSCDITEVDTATAICVKMESAEEDGQSVLSPASDAPELDLGIYDYIECGSFEPLGAYCQMCKGESDECK